MRVFISSVRRGLEVERDSLPSLLLALGHQPLRFEDFVAQSVPSRQACLQGVQAADVYLLLIGPHYGEALPETGQSPTHEEYNTALIKGIPRLLFRKKGVQLEPAQAAFVQEVESYGTGLFRSAYTDAVDLQAKVAGALRDLPTPGDVLAWSPLTSSALVEWREDWSGPRPTAQSMAAELDVHAIPIEAGNLSSRQLRETADALALRLRGLGIVAPSDGIEASTEPGAAWACPEPVQRRTTWEDQQPESILGVRISRSQQRSVWQRLPADRMGSLLDPEDLPTRIAELLRLLGSLSPMEAGSWALAAELRPGTLFGMGSIADLGRRSSAQSRTFGRGLLRVEPDESVSVSAFGNGANDAGRVIAQGLLDALGRGR